MSELEPFDPKRHRIATLFDTFGQRIEWGEGSWRRHGAEVVVGAIVLSIGGREVYRKLRKKPDGEEQVVDVFDAKDGPLDPPVIDNL